MSQVIRIGTRDSELALWQAQHVQEQLESLGHKTVLVPVKSTGDLILDKPLHELGITGIFTKTLDVALLKNEIDIAVHSMKDVPTALPHGIVQAAVLERGNFLDILAYRHNQEFTARKDAVIATGSLRRKAQWLNRYPTHTVVDLRGNVNTRLRKLEENEAWNGAIFAGAGLERLGLRPKNTIGLTWMVPAPAQGALLIAARESDMPILELCKPLHHHETSICVHQERLFLRTLEGGCTAPIGALATIDENRLYLKGVLLSRDGRKKLEVEMNARIGNHQQLGIECANSILSRGGKRLMSEGDAPATKKTTLFSTKKLTAAQHQRFKDPSKVIAEDFIQISHNRIPSYLLKAPIRNVVITSRNAVEALLTHSPGKALDFENIYCVGRKTKQLIERHIGKVRHQEKNSRRLAQHMVEYLEGLEVTYFCSDQRMDDLPDILKENNIEVREVEAYQTKLAPITVDSSVEGVLFFSPSAIESYLLKNPPDKIAFCIGETTAREAREHFKEVHVARIPTVESVIDLVNEHYDKK